MRLCSKECRIFKLYLNNFFQRIFVQTVEQTFHCCMVVQSKYENENFQNSQRRFAMYVTRSITETQYRKRQNRPSLIIWYNINLNFIYIYIYIYIYVVGGKKHCFSLYSCNMLDYHKLTIHQLKFLINLYFAVIVFHNII